MELTQLAVDLYPGHKVEFSGAYCCLRLQVADGLRFRRKKHGIFRLVDDRVYVDVQRVWGAYPSRAVVLPKAAPGAVPTVPCRVRGLGAPTDVEVKPSIISPCVTEMATTNSKKAIHRDRRGWR